MIPTVTETVENDAGAYVRVWRPLGVVLDNEVHLIAQRLTITCPEA